MYKSIYGADASYCNNGNALNAAEIFFWENRWTDKYYTLSE